MEFSQRPAHSTLPGAHGFMPAVPPPAHRAYAAAATDSQQQQQQFYTHQLQLNLHHSPDAFAAVPRRLPSVSELLESQGSAQQAAVAALLPQDPAYAPAPSPYSLAATQKPYAIDVPAVRSAHHQHHHHHHHHNASAAPYGAHRNSESASSVSSQATLLGSYSPSSPQLRSFGQHVHAVEYNKDAAARAYQLPIDTDADMRDQDEVYTAASILMSLRACKMPC